VMGNDPGDTGTGEPVTTFKKPDVGKSYPAAAPQTSDEFDSSRLGLQWQWLANPQAGWFSLTDSPGHLRLVAQPPNPTMVRQPNLLLQKIPAPAFAVTTKLEFTAFQPGEKAGLVIYGAPCAWIGLVKTATGLRISQTTSRSSIVPDSPDIVVESAGVDVTDGAFYLAFNVGANSRAQFSYSLDGKSFTALGAPVAVAAVRSSWIGAKFGLFAIGAPLPEGATKDGATPAHADFDWIHVAAPKP